MGSGKRVLMATNGLIMSSRNSRGLSAQATRATCSFFWSLTSLSPLHPFHLIFLLVFSLVFSSFSPRFLFFLSKYMSTTGALLQDGNDGPLMEWDDDDNDNDDVSESHVSQGISKTPSTFTASSQSLATSSQLSQPSGLPIDTIARLTHDELKHNPEFMRCLGMVNLLQELLNLRQKDAPICESPSFTPYFSLRSLCLFVFFFFLASTAVNSSAVRPCARVSRLRRYLVSSRRSPSLSLGSFSAPPVFCSRSSGPPKTARTTPMPASPPPTCLGFPCGARSDTKTGR